MSTNGANNRALAFIFLSAGALFILHILNKREQAPTTSNPNGRKEAYYLRFNKDELFKNLIAAEEHFRNVERTGVDRDGAFNCAVKHLASGEGHSDEAVSHSLIAESEETSLMFQDLRDDVRELRHDLQAGLITASEGLRGTRGLRREFERFNPEYDISKCEACQISVKVEGLPLKTTT